MIVILAMLSPIPVLGMASAQDLGAPESQPEYAVTFLTEEERTAFLELYSKVFIHQEVLLEDTPGEYADWHPELRIEMARAMVQALKDDPTYSARLDPVNAGPALGFSTEENPLVDSEGNPVTQERVDGVYEAFLYGLIFEREVFIENLETLAQETMAPEDQEEEVIDPDEQHSEADNEIRKEFAVEPLRHWANENTTAVVPDYFDATEPVLIDEPGIPFETETVDTPLPADLPTAEKPVVEIDELQDPLEVITEFQIDAPEIPELAAEPTDLTSAVITSPMSAATPAEWADPQFQLELPRLLEFLRDFANMGDELINEVLGLVGNNLRMPAKIQGTLDAFPEVAGPVADLTMSAAEFAEVVLPLSTPSEILAPANLPTEVMDLIGELEREVGQLQFTGTVNGERFNGTWFSPVAVDVTGDGVADLLIQMNLEAEPVDAEDGIPNAVNRATNGEPVFMLPRLVVERINGYVAPGEAAPGAPATPEVPDPSIDTSNLPPLLQDAFDLDPLSNVPITQEQLEIAGVAFDVPPNVDPNDPLIPELPDTEPFPYHLTVVFHLPGSDELMVHDVQFAGSADTLDVMVRDASPSIDVATAGAAGAFEFATSVLHDDDPAGDVSSLALSADQPPVRLTASSAVEPDADMASLSLRPLAPMDLTASARRSDATGGLAIIASSEEMPALDFTVDGDNFAARTIEGAGIAYAAQRFGTGSSFVHRGVVVSDAAPEMEFLVSEDMITMEASQREAEVRAIAGGVTNGVYDHATWAHVIDAGRNFELDASAGLSFSNDASPQVRAVVAETSAAALAGEVAGFQANDERAAFGLPAVRSAKIVPDDEGGFIIDASTTESTAFLMDVERTTANGLERERFSFSNLPSRLSAEIRDGSVNLGSSEPVDQVVGDMSRPLDGPGQEPTQAYVVLDDLDGSSSVAMSDANVNVMATGALESGTVLASNVVNGAGNHEFLGVSGNHMLAEVQDTARQYSAKVTGMASLSPDVGGVISGLAGGIGSIDLDLRIDGPLCWSFGKQNNRLEVCISNVPEHISVDFNLVPQPSIGYHASEEINELSVNLIAEAVDILFYVRGIPEDVVMEFTRDGMDLVMSDRLDAIGMAATLRDTTIAAFAESIPSEIHFGWGEGGMNPGIPAGDAIGRVFASVSRPGLGFFADIHHLPPTSFSWESGAMDVDLSGDRIGSVVLQLVLSNADVSKNLQLLFQAHDIPGVAATWGAAGGTLATSGALGGASFLLAQGPSWRPTVSLQAQIENVPQITGASWTSSSFDLPLSGGRIGLIGFQFNAADMVISLTAKGVPGLHMGWTDAGGQLSTDGTLDEITAYFRKGSGVPFTQLFLQITDVPRLQGATWGASLDFDIGTAQIGSIVLEFISDQHNNANDLYVLLRANGLPGFEMNPAARTLSTSATLDSLTMVFRKGAAWAPSLFVSFVLEGVPRISAASWADGLRLAYSPSTARINRIDLTFLSDAPGTGSDLYANLGARGVPGINLDASAGDIGTAAVLDQLYMDFRLGAINSPTVHMFLDISGVPRITGGAFDASGFELSFSPSNARISSITLFSQVNQYVNPWVTNQLQLIVSASGVPGIDIGMGAGGGTISTAAPLGGLGIHFHNGRLGAPSIIFDASIQNAPQLTASSFNSGRLDLNMAGRIGYLGMQFILDPAGVASDLFFSLGAWGVPGIDVEWAGTDGGISTSDTLDAIDLRAIVGPRSGLNLNGEGVALQFTANSVPRITGGTWDKDSINLGLAGRISSILAIFEVNQAGSANDIYLRFLAQGVPGIGLNFANGGGSISTTGTLDLIDFRAIIGPRSGLSLVGNGIYALFQASGVPRIAASHWDTDSMGLSLSGKINNIKLEIFVNSGYDANDIYLLLDAWGVPSLSLTKSTNGFNFNAPGGINSAAIVFRKGTFAYNPYSYGNTFIGAWLRPDGYGTWFPGQPQFGITARVAGLSSVTWNTNTWTNTQTLGLNFAQDPSLRAILDLKTGSLTAFADLSAVGIPRASTINISPDVTSYSGTPGCSGWLCPTPWLQGEIHIGTTGTSNQVPAPYWPWQTYSDPAGKCYRSGYGYVHCGIMGNTKLDLINGGLATKIKISSPLPTSFSFSKSTSNGVPGYSLNAGVKLGKLDMRVLTSSPLPYWPYQLNLMAVATVSNLPTSLSVGQNMGTSTGAKPSITVNTAQSIEKIFVGVRLDGSFYGDPGLISVVNSNVNSAGFPLWLSVEDIPTSVSFTTGKSSYQTSNCSSCNAPVPYLSYSASSRWMDATAYVNIGQIWNTVGKSAIQAAGSAVPNWLRGLANYNSHGHLLLQLVNIPRDGISIYESGDKLVVDPSPYYGERLTKFFADFQILFNDGKSKPSTCIVCLGIADLKYYWFYGWWFGIETLSLLLEDLGKMTLDPNLESVIYIDGKMVLHFRAGAGFNAGAGLELYVAGARVLCVCINLPWISLIVDPGFISFQVLNWSCCKFDYFWLGSPFHATGGSTWGVPNGHFCWCDWHYWVRASGTYPGNWGFDLPVAFPPYVPFRGLNIQYGTHHVFINPRLMACVSGDWTNPAAFCWQIGRLLPNEFFVAYAMLKYFSISLNTGSTHHHH